MKLSGFTIIRNAIMFDFPVVEAIKSVLPIVDEFIVVAGDSCDNTNELIQNIGSSKIRIVHSNWDLERFSNNGTIYAYQTDLALRECSGDWCFYIQSDEVLHEDGLQQIRQACENYVDDLNVEGFVLRYIHIYADYRHYIDALHFAYPKEIRIVRNRPDIHSWRDAQSFRVYEDFSDMDYQRKEGSRKLRCKLLNAYMFHYGWSRNPYCMAGKMAAQRYFYHPEIKDQTTVEFFDYGNLSSMPLFKSSQPKVMQERIEGMNWQDTLRYTGARPHIGKRNELKYRIINFIEHKILSGRCIGGFRNYDLI